MSSSAKGKVFYGIVLDEDAATALAERLGEDEWETLYAAAKGEHEPTAPYEENKPLYKAYWDRKRQIIEACPVEIDWHGYIDGDERHVAIRASVVDCYATLPHALAERTADPVWESQLREFCNVTGIPFSASGWWLVASYG